MLILLALLLALRWASALFDILVGHNPCPVTASAFLQLVDLILVRSEPAEAHNDDIAQARTFLARKHDNTLSRVIATEPAKPNVLTMFTLARRCQEMLARILRRSNPAIIHCSWRDVCLRLPRTPDDYMKSLECVDNTDRVQQHALESNLQTICLLRRLYIAYLDTAFIQAPTPKHASIHQALSAHDHTIRLAAMRPASILAELVACKGQSRAVQPHFVHICALLYDTLNDDDEEIRAASAKIVSGLLSVKGATECAHLAISPIGARVKFRHWILSNAGSYEG